MDSSAPRRSLALKLAADLARTIGMTPTWPNVQTIRLAIEGEADYSDISVKQAAAVIAMAANEQTLRSQLVCPPSWALREIARENTVDRFWFEDARWRSKLCYAKFTARLREAVST